MLTQSPTHANPAAYRRIYRVAHRAGILAIIAAASSMWLGSHMHVWAGILGGLSIALAIIAETTTEGVAS